MAFSELYRFEYRDQPLGRLTTVKILQDGYTGAFSWVDAGQDPVIIEAQNDNDYIFNQIYGSSVTIDLIATTNFQFIGLFSSNAFKNKVEIWKEPEPDEAQELFWVGYILPDQYSEPIDFVTNYNVSVTARDALGALKNIDFLQESGNRFVGKQQVIKIIADVLKKTKLDININFSLNIIENNTPQGVTNDTLENIFLDYAVFYQDKVNDCDYVLTQILQSFGARIIQANGEWWIERITMYTTSQTIFKYDKDGKYLSSFIYNNVLTYTGKYDETNNRLYFCDKKGNLEINPAFKSFEINQDFGKIKGLFSNSSFEQFSGQTIDGWYNGFSVDDWYEVIERETAEIGSSSELNKYCVRLSNIRGVSYSLRSKQVQITIGANKGLRISWEAKGQGSWSFLSYVAIKIGTQYLQLTDATPFYAGDEKEVVLSSSGVYIDFFTRGAFGIYTVSYIPTAEITDYITFYVRVPGNNLETTWNQKTIFDNISVEFINSDSNSDYPEDANYSTTIDLENNKIPEPVESILGDLPGLTDNEDVYIGGYWYFDGSGFIPTSSWSVYASERELSLMALLAEDINDQYRNPKHKITGTLCGNFQFNKAISIGMLQNKLYLPMRMSLSDKYCKCTSDMLELSPYTEAIGGIVWGTEDLDYVVSNTDVLTKI